MPEEPGHFDTQEQDRIVDELQTALERASGLLHDLQGRIPSEPPADAEDDRRRKVEELKQRLADAETDLTEVSDRLVEAEHQRGRLMSLYVATYQLHATLDLNEVTIAIAEIARDLLGAERFALLVCDDKGGPCEVALAEGFDPDSEEDGLFTGGRYDGGDSMIDLALDEGELRIGPNDGSRCVAVVPLRVQGVVSGAVVMLKLFDHKPALTAEDRDLLDLLAAHAASALFASRVYSRTDRKLRTLESLVKLVR